MPTVLRLIFGLACILIATLQLYFRCMPTEHVLVIMGSGGHTTEMIHILSMSGLINKDASSHYVMARGDLVSAAAVLRLEFSSRSCIHNITRARHVHQPYYTAVFTTFLAFLESAILLIRLRPKLILANGPGTALPLLYLGRMFRSLFGLPVNIVYIESFTRVKRLSATARLSSWAVDVLIVNWKQLESPIRKNIVHIPLYTL